MATFERYFLEDKEMKAEKKNSYYSLYENEAVVDKIFTEFGLDEKHSHTVNGHVPVERKNAPLE